MCEIISYFALTFVDTIISLAILALNIIYIVLGWFQTSYNQREKIEEYIKSLESFLSFVTYSDSFVVPIKILLLILIKFACCKNKNEENRETDQGLPFKPTVTTKVREI